MTYQLPEPYFGVLGAYTADQLREEVTKAELRGRESMREECADHVFNMAQWDENNEQWVVLHRASTAIRNLK